MARIRKVSTTDCSFDVSSELSITDRKNKPGPPQRTAGMTMGIVTMDQNAPHGGEIHPDGDEFIYVISGKLNIVGDSAPDAVLELGPGDACIIERGEWHNVDVLEPTQLIHMTPGPNGDHRPS